MKFSFPFKNCFSSSTQHVSDNDECIPCTQNLETFRIFTHKELTLATNNFRLSNKISEGGFGVVYKGQLPDGTVVAVKVLSVELESLKGEREFIAEITALSNIKHENLVTLRGCCVEGSKRFLVYDYMENTSLALSFLGGEKSRRRFNWERRRDISLGIARGLAFLHEEVKPYIVHRDIKASNILLDKDFIPKIADFGLSKLFTSSIASVSTRVAGTLGYLAPEYALSGRVSRRADVYSFGVVLLQIVTGGSVREFNLQHGERHLVDKVWENYKADNLLEMADPVLNTDSPEEVVRFLKVGLLCVQKIVNLRPPMSQVVKMLNNEVDIADVSISQPGFIDDPKHVKVGRKSSSNPAFCSSHSSDNTSSFPNSISTSSYYST
ncbi:hypothetical protein Ancab_014621 [Ancistrocladus abbreviatus]